MTLLSLSPVLSLSFVALVVLVIEATIKKSERLCFWISVFGVLLSLYFAAITLSGHPQVLFGMIAAGGYGNFFAMLFLISALLTIVLSRPYLEKSHKELGEFYLLILFATLGMMFIASAADLIMIFLGIELMSICLYILAGYARTRIRSNESSLKYFLLGAFATGFLLYGIALLYGAGGTTNIASIVEKLPALASSKIFWAGIGLLLVGFAFKVAAVPFHMWVPDVYEGAPTTVSGFMSTGAKAAAFAAFVLIFAREFPRGESGGGVQLALSVVAAASMILGNVVAISQTNIKRMLAYSSVAHAGYMLTGLAAGNQLGKTGILFYLTAYTFMNIGAFGILSYFEQDEEKHLTFDDYVGLANRRPYLAALMAVFMFSLSGIPPFAGFVGKYYVFAAAINAHLTWLAILGVLTSVVGVYYYLRLVVVMYFSGDSTNSDAEHPAFPSKLSIAVLTVAALAVVALGVFPSTLLSLIQSLL